MIKILIVSLIAVAGLIIGPMIAGHQGMAFFQLAGYRIKMSFTTFIVAECLLLICLYLLYWFINRITRTGSFLGRWVRFLSPKKSIKRIEQANLMLLEGNYKKAEKLFTKSAKYASNSALTYLQAAQAAIDGNELITANQLLEKAAKHCNENNRFAFQLVQIRLQIKNQEFTAAKHCVQQLLEQKPRHPEVLRLADQIYYSIEDYQSIIDILPAMYKVQAYGESQLDQFKQAAYIGRIRQLATSGDPSALSQWWKALPRAIKNNIIYQKAMANYLTQLGHTDEANKFLITISKNEKSL